MTELTEMQPIVETCENLKEKLNCEFVGLAIQNEIGPDIRWRYASGNINDKYKRITLRYGKGIAGKVISSGGTMMIQDFPSDITGKAIEHPIMLAEKLVSSFAVPLFFNGVPKGVLLVGKRRAYTFSDHEQEIVQDSASILEHVLKDYITL